MAARLMGSMAGGAVDVEALTARGTQALAEFSPAQLAAIGGAYRSALTGCFLLSGVVMTSAFVLVLGLKEQALRDGIGDARPHPDPPPQGGREKAAAAVRRS
jgi:hypothetical protein